MNDVATKESGIVRVIGGISTACGVVASFMILAAVLITCQMIFVRAVLGKSTIWQTEAVIYLMISATLIGLPFVQKLKGHVGVDLLPTLLPRRLSRALTLFTLALTLGIILVMLYYGWDMYHLAWSRGWRSETVWGVPLWIPYLSIPVGFGLFALQLLADLWDAVTRNSVPLARKPEDRRH